MQRVIPRWKPKRTARKRNNLEDQYQERVFQWAAENEEREPRLKFLFAVPNGGHRNIIVAAKLKRQGVKRGVPDIFLPVQRLWLEEHPEVFCSGLWIEMKAGKNKPSHQQMEWIDFLRKHGYRVVICWSAEEAIREIQTYLSMIPG